MLGITRQTLPSLQLQGIEVDSRWGPHGMVRSREARKVALSWFSVATQGVLTLGHTTASNGAPCSYPKLV